MTGTFIFFKDKVELDELPIKDTLTLAEIFQYAKRNHIKSPTHYIMNNLHTNHGFYYGRYFNKTEAWWKFNYDGTPFTE